MSDVLLFYRPGGPILEAHTFKNWAVFCLGQLMTNSIPGEYSKYTREKHIKYRRILRSHLKHCRGIFDEQNILTPYKYIDCFGGRGKYPDTVGSPMIFKEERHLLGGYKWEQHIWERHLQNHTSLTDYIGTDNVYWLDCRSILTQDLSIKKKGQYGMMFLDSEMDKSGFEVSKEIATFTSEQWEDIDIVFYIAPTNLKRFMNSNLTNYFINNTNKREWIISEPLKGSTHRYVFLVATNQPNWAEELQGFYNINSEKGKKILHNLDTTKKEKEERKKRESGQISMFPIEPMRNI